MEAGRPSRTRRSRLRWPWPTPGEGMTLGLRCCHLCLPSLRGSPSMGHISTPPHPRQQPGHKDSQSLLSTPSIHSLGQGLEACLSTPAYLNEKQARDSEF